MKDLLSLFTKEVAGIETAGPKELQMEAHFDLQTEGKTAAARAAAKKASTIIQFSSIPIRIDLNQYKKPFSPDHPDGDYFEAFNFRNIADPIPAVSSIFQTTKNSTERLWGNLLYSASGKKAYSIHVIADAQSTFENYKLSNYGGAPDPWRPVFANPSNWYELAKDKSNYTPITLDFEKDMETDNNFVIINDNSSGLMWRSFADNNLVKQMELKGKLNSIEMKVMRIDFVRPWLIYEVLSLPDLVLDQEPAYFSSGTFEDNDGVLPLISSSILIGTDINVKGSWDDEDQEFIKQNSGGGLALGPFALSEKNIPFLKSNRYKQSTLSTGNTIQILGYMSQLVPLAPK